MSPTDFLHLRPNGQPSPPVALPTIGNALYTAASQTLRVSQTETVVINPFTVNFVLRYFF